MADLPHLAKKVLLNSSDKSRFKKLDLRKNIDLREIVATSST